MIDAKTELCRSALPDGRAVIARYVRRQHLSNGVQFYLLLNDLELEISEAAAAALLGMHRDRS